MTAKELAKELATIPGDIQIVTAKLDDTQFQADTRPVVETTYDENGMFVLWTEE